MTNYAPPPQLIEDVPYRDLDEMRAFAERWREQHRGQWFTVPKLSGFCLLMKRDVYEAIGGIDEQFGPGLFDDDDLAIRARQAGFELAVAHDLFVHHFGSRTFAGNGIDTERLLSENQQQFAAKWRRSAPRGQRMALQPFDGHEETVSRKTAKPAKKAPSNQTARPAWAGPSVDQAAIGSQDSPCSSSTDSSSWRSPFAPSRLCVSRPKVSLAMIVRDEQENLPHCLGSVAGLFDEIVVVDTGSTDRTREIAREFGARVFDFVWVDDFAAARNAALARATGDYALWLDADDVIDPPQRVRLEQFIGDLRPAEQAAHVVKCACDPGPDGSGGDTVVDRIRLFPLRQDVRWTYRVHEQILPALRRANVPVRWTDVTVRHTGYTDRALRARKLDRDARILRQELAERPDDPFVLFNLGSIAIERQDWRRALDYLRHSLAGSAPTDSITRKLYAVIARSHQMLGEPQQALAACAAGTAVEPDDAELLFREAIVRRRTGDSDGAERCWRRILTLKRAEQFASVDQGIYGHLTRRNLAALAKERGDQAEAANLWRAVLAEWPNDREARDHLGK
jgi:glycosyltransferase involved in cell wall biosynthesis